MPGRRKFGKNVTASAQIPYFTKPPGYSIITVRLEFIHATGCDEEEYIGGAEREDGSPAERLSEKAPVEGSFRAGRLNHEQTVGSPDSPPLPGYEMAGNSRTKVVPRDIRPLP